MEGGISAVQDVFNLFLFLFFWLVIVVWIGEQVLQTSTNLPGFSLRNASQGNMPWSVKC